jgi:hypothetical protein
LIGTSVFGINFALKVGKGCDKENKVRDKGYHEKENSDRG